jgi:hypothetical protein
VDVTDEVDPRSAAGLLFGATETITARRRTVRVDRVPGSANRREQIALSWIEPRGTRLSVIGTGVELSELQAIAESISFESDTPLQFSDARASTTAGG